MAIQSQAKGAAAQSEMVHKIKVNSHSSSKKPDNRDQSLPPCYRCGKGNHSPVACKFKTATCDGCGKVGHIRPACFSKNKSKQQRVARAGNVRHVREKENEEEAYELFNTPSTGKSKPYLLTLEVESRLWKVDTGASLSIISEKTKNKLWPSKRLLPTSAKLKTYSGRSCK